MLDNSLEMEGTNSVLSDVMSLVSSLLPCLLSWIYVNVEPVF